MVPQDCSRSQVAAAMRSVSLASAAACAFG